MRTKFVEYFGEFKLKEAFRGFSCEHKTKSDSSSLSPQSENEYKLYTSGLNRQKSTICSFDIMKESTHSH